MPREWPKQTVTAVVTTKSASAPQVKNSGPPISAARVMPEIHRDLTGFQRRSPAVASVSALSNMRGERKVLAEAASASSIGPWLGSPGGLRAASVVGKAIMAMALPLDESPSTIFDYITL